MKPGSWYKNAIFYEIYLRSFKDGNGDGVGDISGLREKLVYLNQLGVDCIWLLPIYPSPRKDDGYDISYHYAIDDTYGSLQDFKKLINDVHAKKMRIIMDLVLNHTSDQHPWFLAAREDPKSPYHDYYVWSDSIEKYKEARVIFLDTETSNWSWDDKVGKFYWHRFYSCQPDLNYENPSVQAEMLNVVRFWMDLGIDGLRVDAVPYLFEKEGTNCENLPETHEYLKQLRKYFTELYPDKLLLCEANQLPEEVVEYFGEGDEFHMAFHFPLMPKTFIALRSEDKSPIEEVIRHIPKIPEGCQWGTFLRNHDELTLEMVTEDERQWMWQVYAPDKKMRLNLGIRRRLAPLLDNDKRKIKLAYNLLFSLPGSPFLYYGDEIGMGDDISLPDRNGVRTPMQWEDSQNGGFSTSTVLETPLIHGTEYSSANINVDRSIKTADSIWNHLRRLIKIRKTETVFETNLIQLVDFENQHLLGFYREDHASRILFIHNISHKTIKLNRRLLGLEHNRRYIDLLTKKIIKSILYGGSVNLSPYQSVFLKTADKSS